MDIWWVLTHFGGAARREQLLAAGVPWGEIASAVSAGVLVRRHRGVYALPNTPHDVVAARVFRAQVGCVSALAHWGLPLLDEPQTTHLIVPGSRSQSRPGLRGRWPTTVHRSDELPPPGIWVPAYAALDHAADCTSPINQLAALDGALNAGLIVPDVVETFTAGTVQRRRWLARNCSSHAQSIQETVCRVILVEAGFKVREQVTIPEVGRSDILLDDGSIIEVDGYETHSSREAFVRDRRRDRAAILRGTRTLRYTWEDVVLNPTVMAAEVSQLLGRPIARGFDRRIAEIFSPTGFRLHHKS